MFQVWTSRINRMDVPQGMRRLVLNMRIVLNISGERFETYETTLTRFPNTLLGARKKRYEYYCCRGDEYFFNRNRECFEAILYYYQSRGTLNCPRGVPLKIFENECRFFQLSEKEIMKMKRREGFLLDDVEVCPQPTIRSKIRDFVENPESSSFAKTFGIFSIIVVWISIITINFESAPYFNQKTKWKEYSYEIEFALNLYFLVELSLRAIFADSCLKFLSNPMNLIDIAAVLPYFTLLVVRVKQPGIVILLKVLKVFSVFRLFRLTKHSHRITVAIKIIQRSLENFRIMMLCFSIINFIGASFIYHIESQHPFTSIPQCLWWSLQTITTVGYGDMIPCSVAGRLFTGTFMCFGVITMSLPLLSLITQFVDLYSKNCDYDSLQQPSKIG